MCRFNGPSRGTCTIFFQSKGVVYYRKLAHPDTKCLPFKAVFVKCDVKMYHSVLIFEALITHFYAKGNLLEITCLYFVELKALIFYTGFVSYSIRWVTSLTMEAADVIVAPVQQTITPVQQMMSSCLGAVLTSVISKILFILELQII